jgi:hypothetical protein
MPTEVQNFVEAAPSTVIPLGYGLFAAATMQELGGRESGGIQTTADPCVAGRPTQDGCPTDSGTDTKTATSTGLDDFAAEPFTVYSRIDCGPVGFWDQADERARRALLGGEARAVERAFWTGDLLGPNVLNPHLAADTAIVAGGLTVQQAATVVVSGGPANGVPFPEAIGLVEGALASCLGGYGTIHVPRWTAATFGAEELVFRDGQNLRTMLGTPVAAGAGYVGTGPDGSTPPAGSAWIYGTGPVTVRRGGVRVFSREESFDRFENRVAMIAERTYVVSWECCLFALLVDVGGFTPPLVAAP